MAGGEGAVLAPPLQPDPQPLAAGEGQTGRGAGSVEHSSPQRGVGGLKSRSFLGMLVIYCPRGVADPKAEVMIHVGHKQPS